MKPLRSIKNLVLIFFQVVVLSLPAFKSNAGTPHLAGGTVTYSGGGSPSSATFNAYITSRPGEVLTESSTGCAYSAGTYYVQCGNFPTSWAAGDILHVDLSDGLSGFISGEVTLTSSSADQLNLVIFMPDISISPVSEDYGNIEIGGNSTEGFTVTNAGEATLSILSTSITGADAEQFSITSGGGSFDLSPGANRIINVQFHPSSAGAKNATLDIASNDPDENPLNVSLSGTGVVPDISASPNPAGYGSVSVGDYSDVSITVSNSGSGNLNIGSTSITGTGASSFNIQSGGGSAVIAPGATRDIVVRFSPQSAGVVSATLSIESNDPDEDPYSVSLSGTGVAPDISASPDPADFGNVNAVSYADISVGVSNNGSINLDITATFITGSDASRFSIQSGGGAAAIAPGATHDIVVRFSPLSAGAASATLSIESNDPDENPYSVSLSGTGVAPDITVSPSSADYGNVLTGENSTQSFTVSNTGNTTLNVSSVNLTGTDAAQFDITAGGGSFSLGAGGTRDVDVRFSPSSTGVKNATLHIVSDDPDEDPFDIPLTGTGAVPDITVSPNPADYGNVNIGSYSEITIAVNNSGNGELRISSTSITGTDALSFDIQSGGGAVTIAAGTIHNIVVRFSPQSAGAKNATLDIASNDPDENPLNVSLSGTGVVPDISASPNPAGYGSVSVGDYSDVTITVSNSGSGNLNIGSTSITGTGASSFNIQSGGGSAVIAPGATRDIVVRFSPQSAGIVSATLSIESNDPDENPCSVSLSGTGMAPDIAVSPSSADYGNVLTGENSTRSFTVSNTGNTTLNVSSVTLTGTDAAQFDITAGGGSFSLSAGNTHDVDVRFSPSSTGVKNATLHIVSDDPDEDSLNLALHGECIVIPDISVSPASKNYGNVMTGTSSNQTFTITNTGTGDLTIDSITVSGTDADDFTIINGEEGFIITPSTNQTVQVQFSPSSTGLKSAVLYIASDDPDENPVIIALTGNGVVTPVSDIQIEPEYYSFGNVEVDSTIEKIFILSNNGTADLIISNIYLDGAESNNFGIEEMEFPFTILPDNSFSLKVLFTPVNTGPMNAELIITKNDSVSGTLAVPITGAGFIADQVSPYLDYCYPRHGVQEAARNADIQLKLTDDESGLNINTLTITVNDSLIISKGIDQTGGNVYMSYDLHHCYIYYFPEYHFPENSPVSVNVRCEDLSSMQNEMDTTTIFNTGRCLPEIIATGSIDSGGGIVTDQSGNAGIDIPDKALEDSLYLSVGIIESPEDIPALPDTISAAGSAYYFGPEGLELNEAVTISIPYTNDDLYHTGTTNPLELPVYCYSFSAGDWLKSEVIDNDDDHIFIEVDELCYLVFGKSSATGLEKIMTDTEYGHECVLYQNYPNPFGDYTTVRFSVSKAGYVKLRIFDMNLREKEVLVSRNYPVGEYTVILNAGSYTGGIYFYQIQTGEFSVTKKMVIDK